MPTAAAIAPWLLLLPAAVAGSVATLGELRGLLVIAISTAFQDSEAPIARFVGKWDQCNWWQMSPRCLVEVLECCDFEVTDHRRRFDIDNVEGTFRDPHFVCHARPRRR